MQTVVLALNLYANTVEKSKYIMGLQTAEKCTHFVEVYTVKEKTNLHDLSMTMDSL